MPGKNSIEEVKSRESIRARIQDLQQRVELLVSLSKQNEEKSNPIHPDQDEKESKTAMGHLAPGLVREVKPFKPPVRYHVKTSQQALLCVSEERALVKNIRASLDVKPGSRADSLSFIVSQLLDPANNRPLKTLTPGTNRARYWDPTNGKVYTRTLPPRGQAKPPGWLYTKKTAGTLLPGNGIMSLFDLNDGILLFSDLDQCKLKMSQVTRKPKYVWLTNVISDTAKWVGADALSWHDWNRLQRAVTLNKLRRHLRKQEIAGTVPTHNEILAGLSLAASRAIGIHNDTLFNRLNALRTREWLRSVLGIHFPILITTSSAVPKGVIHAINKEWI